jgi:hypothetical protein
MEAFPSDFLNTDNTKDFAAMQRTLEALPPVADMVGKGAELKQFLEKYDPKAYRLLRWLITSNRSHLVKLKEDQVPTSLFNEQLK